MFGTSKENVIRGTAIFQFAAKWKNTINRIVLISSEIAINIRIDYECTLFKLRIDWFDDILREYACARKVFSNEILEMETKAVCDVENLIAKMKRQF